MHFPPIVTFVSYLGKVTKATTLQSMTVKKIIGITTHKGNVTRPKALIVLPHTDVWH
jgi:hypothetical protein